MRRRGGDTRNDPGVGESAPVRTIVVVDDDVVVPMMLTIALSETTVIEVSRSGAGLDTVRSVQPDAIVIDRRLPDGDGLELVRLVRSDPATHDIPIVVLTAGYDEADRPEVMEAGADAYLGKPFEAPDLLAVVEELISSRPQRAPRPAPKPAPEPAPLSADTRAEAARSHRRPPLRAASRGTTGLPPPGTRPHAAPLAPANATAPAPALPTAAKVTVDAVAFGASVARAEERAEANAAEVVSLRAELEEARHDNKRLIGIIDSLEAKLLNEQHNAESKAADDLAQALARTQDEVAELREQLVVARTEAEEAAQLRRELAQAYREIEILNAPRPPDAPAATRQRITRKRAPAAKKATPKKKPPAS